MSFLNNSCSSAGPTCAQEQKSSTRSVYTEPEALSAVLRLLCLLIDDLLLQPHEGSHSLVLALLSP